MKRVACIRILPGQRSPPLLAMHNAVVKKQESKAGVAMRGRESVGRVRAAPIQGRRTEWLMVVAAGRIGGSRDLWRRSPPAFPRRA